MTKRTAIQAVLGTAWAMTEEACELVASIAEREHEYAGNLDALEKRLGRPLANTERGYTRDGVGVIPVTGPLFRHANLFTQVSGATSYDTLATDFQAALDDPAVKSIVLKIDSPGGAVDGVSQLASMIAAARGTKPITAYVDGTGASAAYWLASAADRIVAADTSRVGSLGVQMGLTVSDDSKGGKTYRFVSSQSPNKNADPGTEAGASAIQKTVDDLASVFIGAVAENRSTSTERVLESYGGGAVFVAAEALKRGMIDAVASFETLMTEVTSMDYSKLTAETLASERPDLVQAIQASVQVPDLAAVRREAAEAERARIAALDDLAVPGAEDLISKFKADGTTVDVAAIQILKHVKTSASTKGAQALETLRSTEASMTAPASVTAPTAPAPTGQAAIDAEVEKDIAEARALGIIS